MPQVSLSPSVELFPRLVGKNSINTNLEKKGRFTFFAFFFFSVFCIVRGNAVQVEILLYT